jgi:L-ascorbate metabolism protein UlaG (beta-lactamase superfamily)
MDITYLGHSAFKLKGKDVVVVTDPFEKKSVGFSMPSSSADIVTISHHHADHNAIEGVSGTARREKPYVISAPGEYEISGVGVFGWSSFHDAQSGEERGKNTVYSIMMDGVRVVHLGDLGYMIDDKVADGLGTVDVLLVPVGGVYTIGPKEAAAVIERLSPALVIPMHYKTDRHSEKFAELSGLEDFLSVMTVSTVEPLEKLRVMPESLPEQAQVIVLKDH